MIRVNCSYGRFSVWGLIRVIYLVRYGEDFLVGVLIEAELGDVVSDYYWNGVPIHPPNYFGTAFRCQLGFAFAYVINESLP